MPLTLFFTSKLKDVTVSIDNFDKLLVRTTDKHKEIQVRYRMLSQKQIEQYEF